MQWILDNWGTILTVSVSVLAAASVVTRLTPTPVDDGIVAFLQKLVSFLSGLNHQDVGGTKMPLTRPKIVSHPDDIVFKNRER